MLSLLWPWLLLRTCEFPWLEGAATGLGTFSVPLKKALYLSKEEGIVDLETRGTLIMKVTAYGLRFGGGEKPPDSGF